MVLKRDWYKRNPAKFIGGTVGMRWESKCAYAVVLDLIYDGGGSCPDDAQWISNILGVGMSVRRWNAIRADLLSREKITISDGRIYNETATALLAQDSTAVERPSHERPLRIEDKQPRKTDEKVTDLFAASGLGSKNAPETHGLPAGARESQSQNQSRLGLEIVVQHVESIAQALGQKRGKYWEQDFRRMIEVDGFDPVDVLEAARAHKGEPIRSINALRGLARRKRDDRLGGEPVVASSASATDEDWRLSLAMLGARGVWPEGKLGDMPGTPGYRGPKDLEIVFLDAWRAQGRHPVEELDRNDHFRRYPADDPDPERRARWSRIQ